MQPRDLDVARRHLQTGYCGCYHADGNSCIGKYNLRKNRLQRSEQYTTTLQLVQNEDYYKYITD